MGAWIRTNGQVFCAAMTEPENGDIYVDDPELYRRSMAGEWIASPSHLHKPSCDGDNCTGLIIGGAGTPLCGDGEWYDRASTEVEA